MSKDVEWGPWVAHKGTEMPSCLDGSDTVQTWRVDFSDNYLPQGKGFNFEEEYEISREAGDVPWHNPPLNKMVVAYRVKKEPVVEVKNVDFLHPETRAMIKLEYTYTNGKLTKIHWEADNE